MKNEILVPQKTTCVSLNRERNAFPVRFETNYVKYTSYVFSWNNSLPEHVVQMTIIDYCCDMSSVLCTLATDNFWTHYSVWIQWANQLISLSGISFDWCNNIKKLCFMLYKSGIHTNLSEFIWAPNRWIYKSLSAGDSGLFLLTLKITVSPVIIHTR